MNAQIEQIFRRHKGYLTRKQLSDKSAYNDLLQMVNAGTVERIKPGIYRLESTAADRTMIDVEKIVPGGVLCLYSAWAFYDLSVQIPQAFNIAIEKSRKITLPNYPPVTLYYWKREYQELGVIGQKISGISVKMYDLEKSVCDAIRFRNKVGMETTIEVVKNYLKRKDRNLIKLSKYAQKMRINNYMENMIMPML